MPCRAGESARPSASLTRLSARSHAELRALPNVIPGTVEITSRWAAPPAWLNGQADRVQRARREKGRFIWEPVVAAGLRADAGKAGPDRVAVDPDR
jgi:hypothetical protein